MKFSIFLLSTLLLTVSFFSQSKVQAQASVIPQSPISEECLETAEKIVDLLDFSSVKTSAGQVISFPFHEKNNENNLAIAAFDDTQILLGSSNVNSLVDSSGYRVYGVVVDLERKLSLRPRLITITYRSIKGGCQAERNLIVKQLADYGTFPKKISSYYWID